MKPEYLLLCMPVLMGVLTIAWGKFELARIRRKKLEAKKLPKGFSEAMRLASGPLGYTGRVTFSFASLAEREDARLTERFGFLRESAKPK